MKVFLLLLLFVFGACQKNDGSPEAALKDFVESRIGKKVDKDFIEERVTGKLLENLEAMTEEEFSQFADMTNIKSDSFKIVAKSCQESKCFLTYTLSYFTKENDKNAFTSEVKKIAELDQVEGKWLISDVSNVKTYHEGLNPINPLE